MLKEAEAPPSAANDKAADAAHAARRAALLQAEFPHVSRKWFQEVRAKGRAVDIIG